jgi:hypothetical protein
VIDLIDDLRSADPAAGPIEQLHLDDVRRFVSTAPHGAPSRWLKPLALAAAAVFIVSSVGSLVVHRRAGVQIVRSGTSAAPGVSSVSSEPATSLAPNGPLQLDGRTFTSTSIINGKDHPFDGPRFVVLEFSDGTFMATPEPTCHPPSGTYVIEENRFRVLSTDPINWNACMSGMEEDGWMTSVLSSRPTFVASGDNLRLIAGDTIIEFAGSPFAATTPRVADVPTTTAAPGIPGTTTQARSDRLLPSKMPPGFGDVAWLVRPGEQIPRRMRSGEQGVRMFIERGDHPAIVVVDLVSRPSDFDSIADVTEIPGYRSLRIAVTTAAGRRVLLAGGGIEADELRSIAALVTDAASGNGVNVRTPDRFYELDWNDEASGPSITWNGAGGSSVTLQHDSGAHNLAIGMIYPVTVISTQVGPVYLVYDRDGSNLVYATAIVDGRLLNVTTSGVSTEQLIATIESVAPASGAEWERRIANARQST